VDADFLTGGVESETNPGMTPWWCMWCCAATQLSDHSEFGVKFDLGNIDFAPSDKITGGTCTRGPKDRG